MLLTYIFYVWMSGILIVLFRLVLNKKISGFCWFIAGKFVSLGMLNKIGVMRYTVKLVVGEDIMNVGNTDCRTEANLMLRAVKENGSEAWVCDNLQEILVG